MNDDANGIVQDKLVGDAFLGALNAFGASPDRERLRRALDESRDLAAVLTSLVDPSIELPDHHRNYLASSPVYAAVFRSLLEMNAEIEQTFQVEVVYDGPAFSVEVHDDHARLVIRAWLEEPSSGPS